MRRYEHGNGAQCKLRMHSQLKHVLARFQHCKWNLELPEHGDEAGLLVMCYTQSMTEVLRQGQLHQCTPTVYFHCAEDLPIELILDEAAMAEIGDTLL
eukprot:6491735-Amphidinium_carterae.4